MTEIDSIQSAFSKLSQNWYKFLKYDDIYVLNGSFSQSSKRFGHQNSQGAATSVAALVYTELIPPAKWDKTIVDDILILGNRLNRRSFTLIRTRAQVNIEPTQVIRQFYIGNLQIGIRVEKLKMFVLKNDQNILADFVEEMFGLLETGRKIILSCQQRHWALWTEEMNTFIFDGYDHEASGKKWSANSKSSKPLVEKSRGPFAVVIRATKHKAILNWLWEEINLKKDTLKVSVYGLKLEKLSAVNIEPPSRLIKPKRKFC